MLAAIDGITGAAGRGFRIGRDFVHREGFVIKYCRCMYQRDSKLKAKLVYPLDMICLPTVLLGPVMSRDQASPRACGYCFLILS